MLRDLTNHKGASVTLGSKNCRSFGLIVLPFCRNDGYTGTHICDSMSGSGGWTGRSIPGGKGKMTDTAECYFKGMEIIPIQAFPDHLHKLLRHQQ